MIDLPLFRYALGFDAECMCVEQPERGRGTALSSQRKGAWQAAREHDAAARHGKGVANTRRCTSVARAATTATTTATAATTTTTTARRPTASVSSTTKSATTPSSFLRLGRPRPCCDGPGFRNKKEKCTMRTFVCVVQS